jgi:transposase-like protein
MAVRPARSVRLSLEDIARVDGLAKTLDTSQQVILESAVKAWLDRAEAGQATVMQAPPKPPTPTEVERAKAQEREAYLAVQAQHLARQEKLNEAKLRASGVRS